LAPLTVGLDSRVVEAHAGLYDWDSPCHTLVEVWIPEYQQWVLIDSMLNVTYRVNGKPASLLEVYDAANNGSWGRITFDRDGSVSEPSPKLEWYRPMFHHLLYAMSNAYFDGYHVSFGHKRLAFAHFAGYSWSQYPEYLKNGLFVAAGFFSLPES
jgi:hypothetical protein